MHVSRQKVKDMPEVFLLAGSHDGIVFGDAEKRHHEGGNSPGYERPKGGLCLRQIHLR